MLELDFALFRIENREWANIRFEQLDKQSFFGDNPLPPNNSKINSIYKSFTEKFEGKFGTFSSFLKILGFFRNYQKLLYQALGIVLIV